jgi:hypothetical protein
MARMLSGSEIPALIGQAPNRGDGLGWIYRNLAPDGLRCGGVIAALRGRGPNKWGSVFWTASTLRNRRREGRLNFGATSEQ